MYYLPTGHQALGAGVGQCENAPRVPLSQSLGIPRDPAAHGHLDKGVGAKENGDGRAGD